jgi:hypothetical protein
MFETQMKAATSQENQSALLNTLKILLILNTCKNIRLFWL